MEVSQTKIFFQMSYKTTLLIKISLYLIKKQVAAITYQDLIQFKWERRQIIKIQRMI